MSDQAQSLEVLSVERRGGRARCPYDPDSNYTIIYVGKHPLHFIIHNFCNVSCALLETIMQMAMIADLIQL